MNFDIEKCPKKKEVPLWVGAVIGVVIAAAILAVTFSVISVGEPVAYHSEQS